MRKISKAHVDALNLADSFAGLPPNISHLELADALDMGRLPLDLTGDELWLMLFWIRHTRSHDWVRGAEPIVAWPAFEICARTGWSEDKLRRIEGSLAGKGLIAFRDSTNCKRFAFRDQNGAIQKNACGISLAPAGARAIEIVAAARQHLETCRKVAGLFDELFTAKRDINSLKGAAGLPDEAKEKAEEIYDQLPRRKTHGVGASQLSQLRDKALRVIKLLRQILGLQTEPAAADVHRGTFGEEPRAAQNLETEPAGHQPKKSPNIRVASIQAWPRKDAGQQESESKSLREDHKLSGILSAAPEMFRAFIEEAQREGVRNPKTILIEATETFGQSMTLKPSFVGRLMQDFGLPAALQALFKLSNVYEKGREVRNPHGYALSIARSDASFGRMH